MQVLTCGTVDNDVQEHHLTDKLVSLALLGNTEDMLDAAQYLEEWPGYEHQAVLLYHKACWFNSENFHYCYCHDRILFRLAQPLGTEVDLGPVDIVLDGDPAPPPQKKGHSSPNSSAHA